MLAVGQPRTGGPKWELVGEMLKKEVSVERGEDRKEGEGTKVEKGGESQGEEGVKALSWLGVEQETG